MDTVFKKTEKMRHWKLDLYKNRLKKTGKEKRSDLYDAKPR